MGMYVIEKGAYCKVGTVDNFSKGKDWTTRDTITFWKEELVSNNGTWALFREIKPRARSGRRYWLAVRSKHVRYG